MTVRIDFSEAEWRRHNQDMEPQRRGSVPPLHSRKRNRTSGLSKTTLEVGVHLQPVGLNAETKKDRHRADGKRCLLTFPYIGLVRFPRLDVAARRRTLRMSERSSDCQAVLI